MSSLHALFLVSAPLSADPVAVDEAVRRLSDALRAVQAPATFHTHVAEADAVSALLARQDRPRFTVLHYFGHGYKPDEVPQGYLIFEDQSGGVRPLNPQQAYMVLNPTLAEEPEFRLAVVMACHSESVAAALHALHVPHIVAVEADESVLQGAALAFFPRFYQVLLTGGTVRAAFTAARNAVALDEDLTRHLGGEGALAEARKFKLLPEDGDHDRPLPDLAAGAGPVDVIPLPALTQHPFDRRPARFLGREQEMQEVLERLRRHRAALVQGVSGVGKTELAKEVARWLVARRRFAPQEVAFVPLARVTSAAQARSAIALALGLDPTALPQDDREGNAALAAALPHHRLLLLDEAENAILAAGRAFRDLLEALATAAARPWMLVTSQRDLGSAHLPRYDLRRLTPAAAVALFLAEAGRLTPEDLERLQQPQARRLLEEILGYVDRLPRAVQLVARQWRHLRSLSALAEELRQKRDRVMADPDYPEEVKSVTVGIQLAYDRLRQADPDAEAATLYPYLALFPGGLPEAGVEPIFGPGARRRVAAIEKEGLLERPWPDLLELPAPFRFFALRHLPEPEAEARARYGEAVLRFYFDADLDERGHIKDATGWVPALDEGLQKAGEAMPLARARYEQELPSIEAWLDWAYDHEPCREGRPARAAHLTALLQNIYTLTGALAREETRIRYQRALDLAKRCRDRHGEANTLQALGDLAMREDRLAEARQHYDQALPLYRQIGDRLGEANTLRALGDLAMRQARLAEARQHYDQALPLYRQIGARLGEANTLRALGDLAMRQARLAEARQHYDQALPLYRQIGDRLGEANTLAALSRLALHEGRDEEAQRLLERAVRLHEAIGSHYSVAADLGNFGLELRRLGRQDEARPYLLQAAEVFDRIGLPQLAEQVRGAAEGQPAGGSEPPAGRPGGLHPAVARMAPLLLGVVAVARGQGDQEVAAQVRAALEQMAQTRDWHHLAAALLRVLEGERDAQALAQNLDDVDRQALALVLAALQDEEARALLEALAAGAALQEATEAMTPEEREALAAQMVELAAEQVVRLAREARQQGRGAELAAHLEAQAAHLAEGEAPESPAAQLAQFLRAVAAWLREAPPPPVPERFIQYWERLRAP